MIITGKPFDATGDDAKERNIRKFRVMYSVTGNPTPFQQKLIDKMEKGCVEGEWTGDPYCTMRNAEYAGIDFWQEELRADGKWHRQDDPDVPLTLMQTGAL